MKPIAPRRVSQSLPTRSILRAFQGALRNGITASRYPFPQQPSKYPMSLVPGEGKTRLQIKYNPRETEVKRES